LAYILAVVVFNLLIYIPVGIYFDLVINAANESNQTVVCNFVDPYWQNMIGHLDLTNRMILPSLLMIIFSISIIVTIFKSRLRMMSSNLNDNNRMLLMKDVRFGMTSICLNFFYILFSLPISILFLLPNYWSSPFYVFIFVVFFSAYSVNFYLMFAINRLFRKCFYSICMHYCKKCVQRRRRDITTGNNNTEMIEIRRNNA
jgi:hypothetical protein